MYAFTLSQISLFTLSPINGECGRIHSLYASSTSNSLIVGLFEAVEAVVLAIVMEKKE